MGESAAFPAWIPHRTGRVLVRAGFLLAAAGLAAQLPFVAVPASTAGGVARVATLGLSAALCLLRAVLVVTDRPAWAMLGLGTLAWTGGELVWTLSATAEVEPGYPSVADVGYLLFYPFALAAVLLLVRARATRPTSRGLLADGVVGMLAAGSVLAAAVGQPLAELSGGDPVALATGLTYPVVDVALVALVVVALTGTDYRERTWWVLGAGVLLFVATDAIWLWEIASGQFVTGERLDVLWTLSAVLLAAASWQRPVQVRRLRLDGWAVLAAPCGSVAVSLVVLASSNELRQRTVAVELAVAAIAVASVRGMLAVRRTMTSAGNQGPAVTDDLTGLANRRLLLRRLDGALSAGQRPHGLVLLDLDRFKEVNDTLGHPVGDELLRRLGPRLARAARPGETVARLGGDEFAVLLPGVADEGAALRAARRILAGLAGPFVIDGLTLFVTASAGVALAPDHGGDSATLLRCADVAMYQAKRARGGAAVYRPGADPHSRTRLESATELRRAIAAGQVVCHYQPQVDIATGATVAVEALARWDDPRRGLVPPADFLALADHAGLMPRLADLVLQTALADCRRWRADQRHLRVAVNLAASTLLDSTLPGRVSAAMDSAGLPAEVLTLEIMEGVLADPGRARETLDALQEMGVRVALDDYGTGRSSVMLLRELSVDQIKLDRGLVTAVAGDPRGRAIVRHTVLMAQALSIEVVAEGVEDPATLLVLGQLGCDYAQGFQIAPPMPADEVAGWLCASRAEPAYGAHR